LVGWRWLAAGLALVVLALSPAIVRIAVRRRRWRRATGSAAIAEAAWAELTDSARDLRIAGSPEGTPRTYADALAEDGGLAPPAREALRRLTRRTEQARYARQAGEFSVPAAAAPTATTPALVRADASQPGGARHGAGRRGGARHGDARHVDARHSDDVATVQADLDTVLSGLAAPAEPVAPGPGEAHAPRRPRRCCTPPANASPTL
jgi:hypothetical protein